MIEITQADYLHDYQIQLHFNNGETKIANLQNYLDGQVFEPLKDKEYFKLFAINFNTIEWKNGADFAPEFLYEIAK